jgi:hypothetical protein
MMNLWEEVYESPRERAEKVRLRLLLYELERQMGLEDVLTYVLRLQGFPPTGVEAKQSDAVEENTHFANWLPESEARF